MKQVKKSRNLSLTEYLKTLELEYLMADIRRKIYPNPKDKRYWSKVVQYKEEKIKDIAERNELSSVLEDKELRNRLLLSFIPDNQVPIFYYRDQKDKNEYYHKDIKFYYFINVEVKYYHDSKLCIGKIIEVDMSGELLRIESEQKEIVKSFDQVRRII